MKKQTCRNANVHRKYIKKKRIFFNVEKTLKKDLKEKPCKHLLSRDTNNKDI